MFYSVLRFIANIIFRTLYRVEVKGGENYSIEGGALICPNHYHWLDPVMIAITSKRKMNFMAKAELFKKKPVAWFLGNCQVYPVKRGELDLTAFKKTISYLKSNELVVLFPEGTRSKNNTLGKANSGVAIFSIKSERPVVPVAITGSYKLFSKITITYGQAINFLDYKRDKMNNDDYLEISQLVMEEIKRLKEGDA